MDGPCSLAGRVRIFVKRIIGIFVLLVMVMGLAHAIESSARPDAGRTGREVEGETHVH